MNNALDPDTLSYWFCNHCHRNLNHGEVRFNCMVCENYDLCHKCYTKVRSFHSHPMIEELAYGKPKFVEENRKSDMTGAIEATVDMYDDRHCLGMRELDNKNTSQYPNRYSWLTFKEIGTRMKNFAKGLRQIIDLHGFLGICSDNRPEWVIADFACILGGIVSVTMYQLFNDSELIFVINNAKVSVIVCDQKRLHKFIKLSKDCPSLRHVICMDPTTEYKRIELNALQIHYMKDIEVAGITGHFQLSPSEPDACVTVIYTSGSSGFPKGAMMTEKAYHTAFIKRSPIFHIDPIYFCYEPLAWVTGRSAVLRTFLAGGRTGFSTGDVSNLMDDLALVRPTSFSATPVIWNTIYAEYRVALSIATSDCRSGNEVSKEREILKKFSKLIPLRCKRINIGGAMTHNSVIDFVRRCFPHCRIFESYGITECGAVAVNNIIKDTLQFRLESIPELGYTTDDKPFPRGELLIKTDEMFCGYMNNSQENREAFTEDGFYLTGDIVEIHASSDGNHHVKVIDRKKNFFKLSNGCYISPELLQSIYVRSPYIEQIYIHGDLLIDSIIAVVVPNVEYIQTKILELKWTHFDLNKSDIRLDNAILASLRSIAKQESLRDYEIPTQIIVDFNRFSVENGLLTSTMKLCRPKLATYYQDQLKRIVSIEQRLKSIFMAITEQMPLDTDSGVTFSNNGGNSFTGVRMSRMIEHEFGVNIPPHVLLQSNMSFKEVAKIINDPTQISAESYEVAVQLIDDVKLAIDVPIDQCKHSTDSPTKVFLTGATGFVGVFLLAELLMTYPSNCEFVCLVREQGAMNSFERIRKNMLIYQLWHDEFTKRIIPLRGDLGIAFFGLNDQDYAQLARDIDVIFHCGAAVNFALPYSRLRSSNVLGTQEIIRLASYTSECTPIHYISTTSVLSYNSHDKTDIDEISPYDLKTGYAQSKWVSEKLMKAASDLGLPITIYRLGFTSASTETGACNLNDLHTHVLAAIMRSSSYPESLVHSYLTCLPVDVTAKIISHLSSNRHRPQAKMYHIMNPNLRVSFQDIVRAVQDRGIRLTSVSMSEWRSHIQKMNEKKINTDFVCDLVHKNLFETNCKISDDDFLNATKTLSFPSLDKAYLMKWLNFIWDHINHDSQMNANF